MKNTIILIAGSTPLLLFLSVTQGQFQEFLVPAAHVAAGVTCALLAYAFWCAVKGRDF